MHAALLKWYILYSVAYIAGLILQILRRLQFNITNARSKTQLPLLSDMTVAGRCEIVWGVDVSDNRQCTLYSCTTTHSSPTADEEWLINGSWNSEANPGPRDKDTHKHTHASTNTQTHSNAHKMMMIYVYKWKFVWKFTKHMYACMHVCTHARINTHTLTHWAGDSASRPGCYSSAGWLSWPCNLQGGVHIGFLGNSLFLACLFCDLAKEREKRVRERKQETHRERERTTSVGCFSFCPAYCWWVVMQCNTSGG